MAGLASLIRLRRFELDAERRALADLEEKRAVISARLEKLAAALLSEQLAAVAADDLRQGFSYADYARRIRLEEAHLADQRAHLDAAILKRRDALTDSFRALKTLEEAEASRRREQRAKRAALESDAMDEIALEGFRRKQSDNG